MDIRVDSAGAGGPPSNDGPASARVTEPATALAAGQNADDVVARQPDDRGHDHLGRARARQRHSVADA
jgi:hypothetical protein